jgi:chemotaxis protein CheD
VLDIYPRKVCFLPASGKAMVKRLASTNTEHAGWRRSARLAQPRRAGQTGGGSVDLF